MHTQKHKQPKAAEVRPFKGSSPPANMVCDKLSASRQHTPPVHGKTTYSSSVWQYNILLLCIAKDSGSFR